MLRRSRWHWWRLRPQFRNQPQNLREHLSWDRDLGPSSERPMPFARAPNAAHLFNRHPGMRMFAHLGKCKVQMGGDMEIAGMSAPQAGVAGASSRT